MFAAGEPVDVEEALANPKTYEDTILRIFTKRSERGAGFSEAFGGVSYFSTAAERRTLGQGHRQPGFQRRVRDPAGGSLDSGNRR